MRILRPPTVKIGYGSVLQKAGNPKQPKKRSQTLPTYSDAIHDDSIRERNCIKNLILTLLIAVLSIEVQANILDKNHFMMGLSLSSPDITFETVESGNLGLLGETAKYDHKTGVAFNAEKYTLIQKEKCLFWYAGVGGEISVIPSKSKFGYTKRGYHLAYVNGGFLAGEIILIYVGIGYGDITRKPKSDNERKPGLVLQAGLKMLGQIFFVGMKYRQIVNTVENQTDQGDHITADMKLTSILLEIGVNF